MGAPIVLWNEESALDQIAAFVVAACPEVQARDIYRAQPSAAPGVFGRSIVILPLTPIPEESSAWGAESDAAQAQQWSVRVVTAAVGAWMVTVLGQTTAPFVAGGGDTPATIAVGLRAAVDALALAVTTAAVAAPPPGVFTITGDTAGESLGVSVTAPGGGAYTLTVVDDNIRRASYNWGLYRVRLMFRDVPSAQAIPASAPRYVANVLAERVRRWLQATSLPVTNGLAYPYRWDQLQAAPAYLSWAKTDTLPAMSVQENGAWVRVVALDVTFQTPVAMSYDVPSLDAMGVTVGPVITDG